MHRGAVHNRASGARRGSKGEGYEGGPPDGAETVQVYEAIGVAEMQRHPPPPVFCKNMKAWDLQTRVCKECDSKRVRGERG